ncbi:MAG: hormogonium polysaccharide biosynthesis protein HpsA [Nostoc sp. EfeVER01]|uniref:hormogonium polysaccharide biosynthesis protein HpsA n=1 Tax=unclassified Nostoc TaxID=2593658 RepID=UPI002AD2577A|nr:MULTISPECIES: hormogonium polysaccharide biosynthesis protein HpsA [unclassified Nostoc]MDZ7946099.1 hormogonium polysaccharide biosynthesis protein HpsA [Nostoc sp. EfeVER01]MDZ7992056.1 hormogonium polysaccharide biosynthesis protein HpsA [Nostoc sp. EspVER01]
MSRKRQLFKVIQKTFRQISKQLLSAINRQIIWLLRTISGTQRRRGSVNSGFVLPTVAMVVLVVVLLTTAILFRSFERSKNASNVRVNEATMQAATPALDRAKAKISALFADPTLPRSVPSNLTLYNTLVNKLSVYTFGDETPITLAYNLNGSTSTPMIEAASSMALENQENIQTAWKFPADTDNNGKFDSFILYGIYFRTPPQTGTTQTRNRSPLDARTPPMLPAKAGGACDVAGDTSASLVGSSGWYKLPTGELKKSFFVYAVTVPISDIAQATSLDTTKYEKYRGNKGFSALEMQQDRSQVSITNNAVVYEDDLDITPGPRFRLNGRIFTNSNLFTGETSEDITFYQVSSRYSCYYERENGKIVVGGNIATSGPISTTNLGGTRIDLFRENNAPDTTKSLADTNKTTSNNSNDIAYNTQAYAQRIDLLVKAQLNNAATTDPQEIKTNITNRTLNDPSLDATKVRKEELENWFRKRTRRVPFREVPYGTSAIEKSAGVDYTTADAATFMKGSVNTLRPMDAWIYPTDANTTLTLNTAQLPTRDPDVVDNTPVIETQLGDRIVLGNNLPELIWDSTKGDFVGENDPQAISPAVKWTGSTTKDRTRSTRVRQLSDLGVTGRDGFWEISAASPRTNILDVVGGLRVITGAGVYRPTGSGLPTRPTPPDDPSTPVSVVNESAGTVVWPDSMPMLVPDPTDPLDASKQKRGDLVMRATVVYHYNFDSYNPLAATPDDYQTPMACVSSYYNPTNQATATTNTYNASDLTTVAASNNGIVYAAPATTAAGITRGQAVDGNGFFAAVTNDDDVTNTSVTLLDRLKHQANLVFPNGRLVNPLLRQALAKATTSKLTLSEQSAIDSTICAIKIADGTLTRSTTYVPDGAIKETAFLDARQIKAIDKGAALTGKYNLEVEQRQPLEIRATTIDLSLLRTQAIGVAADKEYLLPNSGIIYASRDDAQKDRSDSTSDNVSASDYKLDPERRPNAIMLINGSNLSRLTDYRPEEKGLILATELPAYVKGNFNLHAKQEFLGGDLLDPSASNYDTKFYTRTATNRDPNFACRPNDSRLPNCTTGETWRPASVIADAVTLLSSNFREGFRNEGDYDLRNNHQVSDADTVLNRLKAGFWNNNFVTSSNFFTSSNDDTYYKGTPTATDSVNFNSSYLNNFVTPIQRRGSFPEYVMEMCFKIPVSECTETDWYIGYDGDRSIKSHNLPANAQLTKLLAGTTAQSANVDFRRFARRVAFKRDINGKLLTSGGAVITSANISQTGYTPVALGITTVGGVKVVAQFNDGSLPEPANNALWFATTKDINTTKPPGFSGSDIIYKNNIRLFYRYPQVPASLLSTFRDFPGSTTTFTRDGSFQPLLEPVLQLQVTTTDPDDTEKTYTAIASSSSFVKNTRWLSQASETTFNLVIASGDTPARVNSISGGSTPTTYEINGGLHNFVRFLENWNGINANINGSFIQFKRSIYASAPFQVLVRPGSTTVAATSSTPSALSSTANIDSIFFRTLFSTRPGYTSDSTFTTNGAGEAPYYMPPNRNWGFDVALLAQNPDLFAQRFVTPATDPPNEYFREVGRDDLWVKTLLCSVQTQAADGFDTADTSYFGSGFKFALPATERPTNCQLQPS